MHHGNLYIGRREDILEMLEKSIDFSSPDIVIRRQDRLGIDESRILIEEANRKPLLAQKRTFIIAFNSATNEAQNALLKILEEPPVSTEFHIAIPHKDVLLATVYSRLHEIPFSTEESKQHTRTDFIQSSYAERLLQIGDAVKGKDNDWFESVLQEVEIKATKEADTYLMNEVIRVRTYMDSPGVSRKMLFEHLALSL